MSAQIDWGRMEAVTDITAADLLAMMDAENAYIELGPPRGKGSYYIRHEDEYQELGQDWIGDAWVLGAWNGSRYVEAPYMTLRHALEEVWKRRLG